MVDMLLKVLISLMKESELFEYLILMKVELKAKKLKDILILMKWRNLRLKSMILSFA